MSIKIGELSLTHGLCLAPMAGFGDRAMRKTCKQYGAEYVTTEMVSAKAVTYKDKKTFELCKIESDEAPCALQLFGCEPNIVAEAAEMLEYGYGGGVAPVAIDINMGCPVPKIVGNGEGSALMKNPSLVYDIVRATARAVHIPVTVKIRAGFDESHINACEVALAAEEAGASLVCVHGRTKTQMYSGKADRNIIADVKKCLHVPVIANGDVTDARSALEMIEQTGCDGIAIGRGAIGNPFVFAEIASALEGKEYTPPTQSEKIDVALHQLALAIEDKGERVAVAESRKQIAEYIKGMSGAAAVRAKINAAQSYAEVVGIVNAIR